jgi:hypothetical protein
VCTCVLFRTVSEIQLFLCTVPKLLIIEKYYVLFLIPVFIVQMANLVQFAYYNTFSKISTFSINSLCNSCEDMACCFRKPFGIGHMYTYTFFFLLKMTDTATSQNIDLSSWTVCIYVQRCGCMSQYGTLLHCITVQDSPADTTQCIKQDVPRQVIYHGDLVLLRQPRIVMI